MSLFAGNTPKRSRFRLVDVMPKGTLGAGNEKTTIGDGTDVPVQIYVPTAQSVDALEILTPSGSVIWAIDQNGNVKQSSVTSVVAAVARVALTAANLQAMYAAPVQIVAAPGANAYLIPDTISFEMTTTSTQFTGGGIVGFQYDTTVHLAGTLVHAGSIPAAVVTAAAGSSVTGLWAASGANGLTMPLNKGIYISNQTAAFATGTGTAIVKIAYYIVTAG